MFSTIKAIAESKRDGDPMVIADGGIGNNGDIAKALVAGADMVMAGSIFASCTYSPAPWATETPNKKIYFGSASSMNGNKRNIEGRTLVMDCNGMSYQEKMLEIEQDLASSVSYAGGSNLNAFKEVDYALIHE
jgi:GMP reductase